MSDTYVTSNHESHSMAGLAIAELMEAVLEKNVPFRFTAPGFSMTPFIRDGDIITIAQLPVQLHAGDVVAFINPCCRKLTVHRIVHISENGYLIKGDNNPEADGRVPLSAIIGQVIRVEHGGRQIRLGLGIERYAIACLSKREWLRPVLWRVWRVIKPIFRRNNCLNSSNV
ncbi:MAG: S24/S26 family peptidase [Chlorobiaceae bacterium]